jgi:hypothetical protein
VKLVLQKIMDIPEMFKLITILRKLIMRLEPG